jgi:hypothetical protein
LNNKEDGEEAVNSGWVLPPIFKWLQNISNLLQNELLRTFNCGMGMVLVVDAQNVQTVLNELRKFYDHNDDSNQIIKSSEASFFLPKVIGYLVLRLDEHSEEFLDSSRVIVNGTF